MISIDPGKYRTGIFYKSTTLEKSFCIKNRKPLADEYALVNIHDMLNVMVNELYADGEEINFAIIEGYGVNLKKRNSMLFMGEVIGVIRLTLTLHDIPIITMPIQTWKHYCRIESKKSLIRKYLDEVYQKFNMEFDTTDEADAYMMYRALVNISKKTKSLSETDIKIKDQLRKIYRGYI